MLFLAAFLLALPALAQGQMKQCMSDALCNKSQQTFASCADYTDVTQLQRDYNTCMQAMNRGDGDRLVIVEYQGTRALVTVGWQDGLQEVDDKVKAKMDGISDYDVHFLYSSGLLTDDLNPLRITDTESMRQALLLASMGDDSQIPVFGVELQTYQPTSAPTSVDCVLSDWDEWMACSTTCGNGTQRRERTVVVPEAGGGVPCEALFEDRACFERECPVDCVVEEFGDWGTCEGSCAAGVPNTAMSMYRGCYQDCGSVSGDYQFDPANSPFGSLNPIQGITRATGDQGCSRVCEPHTGVQATPEGCRNHCISEGKEIWGMACSNSGGHECWCCQESEIETGCQQIPDIECAGGEGETDTPGFSGVNDTAKCSADHNDRKGPDEDNDGLPDYFTGGHCRAALYSTQPWTEVGSGGSTDGVGEGNQMRSRGIAVEAAHGGAECPALEETRTCELACPVDCEQEDFSEWGECSATCGGGVQTRSRGIITNPLNGGEECGDAEEERACNEQPCPVDCEVSDFSDWGTCEGSCAPTVPNTAMSMYRGCYQDCGSVSGDYQFDPNNSPMGSLNPIQGITRARGDQGCSRVCEPHTGVQSSPEGCRNHCLGQGKEIWGMACSNSGGHECWCCQESEIETDCQQIPDIECAGGEGEESTPGFSGVNGAAKCSADHNDRKGPDEDGDGQPDYYTGGHCRAALYSTQPWAEVGSGGAAGQGTQTRSRSITRNVDHGGTECPVLEESRTCDMQC